MSFTKGKAAAAVAAIGVALAALAAIDGRLSIAGIALAVAAIAGLLYRGRRPAPPPAPDPYRALRRADGPWPAYDRRRSAVAITDAVPAPRDPAARDPQMAD